MKTTKVIVFLILIIVCSVSIASAQWQISQIWRGASTGLYFEDSIHLLSSENEVFYDLGDFSTNVELPVGDGVLTSSQTSLVSNDDYTQASMSGDMSVSITQPAIGFPDGMGCKSEVQFLHYSPWTCDYSLSGVVSGPGQVTLFIEDWFTKELISTESWTGTDFTSSGQLPGGNYFIRYYLSDYSFCDEPVSRYSECDFEFIIFPQLPVATSEMSFGSVKALFR